VVIRRLLLHYKVLHILIVPKEPSSMFVTLMRKGVAKRYPLHLVDRPAAPAVGS
jgi:hypothetical protein